MPKGPKGEKRPADTIGTAIKVANIAIGEIEEDIDDAGISPALTFSSRLRGILAGVAGRDRIDFLQQRR